MQTRPYRLQLCCSLAAATALWVLTVRCRRPCRRVARSARLSALHRAQAWACLSGLALLGPLLLQLVVPEQQDLHEYTERSHTPQACLQ